MKSYIKYFCYSACLIALIIPIAVVLVPIQECQDGFYSRDGSPECTDCKFTLGDACQSCVSGFNCTSCLSNHFLDTGLCFSCEN